MRSSLRVDTVPAYVEPAESPIDGTSAFPYVLMSAKNGYYCHTQHRGLASLRRKVPEPIAEISPELAGRKRIVEGDWATLRTRASSARFKIKLKPSLHPSVISADYGWWDICPDLGLEGTDPLSPAGSNFNALIANDKSDPLSGSIPHRSFLCDIEPDSGKGGSRDAWDGFRRFHIKAIDQEAEEVVSVHLEALGGGDLPDFRPGQHITIRLPEVGGAGHLIRTYSLSGAAKVHCRQAYRITVRRLDERSTPDFREGLASNHIVRRLRPGDAVEVRMPAGTFSMPLASDFPVVLIAAGIGITPFMSYLESLLGAEKAMPAVTLYYGNRNGTCHAFKERIRQIAPRLPRLQVLNYYSAPLEGERVGIDFDVPARISADRIRQDLIESGARFYLCGPGPMLKGVTSDLVARGVPAFRIFYEVFQSPANVVSIGSSGSRKVRFAKSNHEAIWTAADGTLLNFAEARGIKLPSGCRVGQCEGCAVPRLEGEVSYLTPLEARPDTCLTCQAIPATDLVLDA